MNMHVIPLIWSDPSPPDDTCPYDHVRAVSPFGDFRITWKGWKEESSFVLDETPWGFFAVADSLDDAKEMAHADYEKRILAALSPIL